METYTHTTKIYGKCPRNFRTRFSGVSVQARLKVEVTHFHDYSNMRRLLHLLHTYAKCMAVKTEVSLGSVFN